MRNIDADGHFDGLAYAYYDTTSNRAISSVTNAISMQIRTYSTDGILLVANGTNNYIILELNAGYVRLRLRFTGSSGGEYVIDNGIRISDNIWHRVEFTRDRFYGILNVDGIRSPNDKRPQSGESDNVDINQIIYIGGVPSGSPAVINLNVHGNYSGCLRNVAFNGNSVLSNALDGQANYGYVGNIARTSDCNTVPQQFVAANLRSQFSGISVSWTPTASYDYSFEFWFRTTETGFNHEILNLEASNNVVITLSQGTVTMLLISTFTAQSSKRKVNDGSWHLLRLIASSSAIGCYVDDEFLNINFSQPLTQRQFPQVTIGLKSIRGFVGCVRGVKIDGVTESIGSVKFSRSGVSVNSCTIQNFCKPFTACFNNASCVNTATSFTCSCGLNSNYEGSYCETC